MGKRKIVGILVGVILLFIGGVYWVGANDTTPPPVVIIHNTGYRRYIKGPVKFPHEKHVKEYKIACTECHHIYVNGKNVWKEGQPVKKCAECHSPIRKRGQKPIDLMHAYHKNCMGCHRKLAKEGKISMAEYKKLRRCNTCHQKKI